MTVLIILLPVVIISLAHSAQPSSAFANQLMQPHHQSDLRYELGNNNNINNNNGGVSGPAVMASSLGCNRRLYTYRITQADSMGRECWDHVSVWSCWGRCDSKEISDWKFPYKRSYHPVCMHAGRSKAVAYLRQCHPDVEPETKRYEYMEAIGCHCQVIFCSI